MTNLELMPRVLAAAIAVMTEKARTYGESWKSRGGRGAWYTLVRPLDRLQLVMERDHAGDIFAAIEAEPEGGDGSVLDMVRDLRNYLTLVETEMVNRGVVKLPSDNAPRSHSEEEPTPAYVDQDQPDDHLGVGPLNETEEYTTLDLGHGTSLWKKGLSAFSGLGTKEERIQLDQHIRRFATQNASAIGCLIASRQIEGGDRQIIIRIPGTPAR